MASPAASTRRQQQQQQQRRRQQEQQEQEQEQEQQQQRRSARRGVASKRSGSKNTRPLDAVWVEALAALPEAEEERGRWRQAFSQQTPCDLCSDEGGLVVKCANSGKEPGGREGGREGGG